MSKKTANTAKSGKHPEMTDVEVIFTNGEKLKVKMSSSYGKDTLYLQSDHLTHRAWNPDSSVRHEVRGSRAQKYASRFPSFGVKK